MFKLTDRNRDVYLWAGVNVELNLSFDNVLMLLELFEDKTVPENTKPSVALNMLVVDKSLVAQLDGARKERFFIDVLRDKLNIDLSSTGKKRNVASGNDDSDDPDIPIVDFVIDAERIFASFLFDYGMNLLEQQGKLTWEEFLALFNNLSDKTPMGIAIHYRTCEIPKKDSTNADERKRIKQMKELYELPEAKAIREQMEYEAYHRRMESQKKLMKR
ncbi:Gp15 family bacteriophage protein [Bacillus sp. AFS075034]|uniref:Gp15 family bacteriophage protein n=1 Tax=Bacillus sp. AFS075034 TaxID=2034281 RepID=UPI000BF6456F|nr:Gp15 family bacteriophage protein [Bacillus sp. AFS075034]PFW65280.1 hypothetical protein COL20_01185 [Bacillus sp. AFS075034]